MKSALGKIVRRAVAKIGRRIVDEALPHRRSRLRQEPQIFERRPAPAERLADARSRIARLVGRLVLARSSGGARREADRNGVEPVGAPDLRPRDIPAERPDIAEPAGRPGDVDRPRPGDVIIAGAGIGELDRIADRIFLPYRVERCIFRCRLDRRHVIDQRVGRVRSEMLGSDIAHWRLVAGHGPARRNVEAMRPVVGRIAFREVHIDAGGRLQPRARRKPDLRRERQLRRHRIDPGGNDQHLARRKRRRVGRGEPGAIVGDSVAGEIVLGRAQLADRAHARQASTR